MAGEILGSSKANDSFVRTLPVRDHCGEGQLSLLRALACRTPLGWLRSFAELAVNVGLGPAAS